MSLIPPSPGTENVQVNGDAALGKLFIELRHCTGRDELAHHLAIASGSGACLEQEHILQLDGSAFHARQLSDVADLARTAGEALLVHDQVHCRRDLFAHHRHRQLHAGHHDHHFQARQRLARIVGMGGGQRSFVAGQMSNEGKPKKYKNGGIIPMMRLGGMMKGPSHSQGGVPLIAEGDEYIVNKKDTAWSRPVLDTINYDGARSWTSFSTGVEQQQKLLKDQLATNYQFGNAIVDLKRMIKDSAQKQNAMLTEGEENKRPFLANVMSLFGATGGSSQGRAAKSKNISPSLMPTRNLRPQSQEGKSGFIELPPIVMNAGSEDIELPTFADQEEGIPSILSYDSNNEYLNISLDYYNIEGIRFGD